MFIRVSLRLVLNMVYVMLVKWRRIEIVIGLISRCFVIYFNFLFFGEVFDYSGIWVYSGIKN